MIDLRSPLHECDGHSPTLPGAETKFKHCLDARWGECVKTGIGTMPMFFDSFTFQRAGMRSPSRFPEFRHRLALRTVNAHCHVLSIGRAHCIQMRVNLAV